MESLLDLSVYTAQKTGMKESFKTKRKYAAGIREAAAALEEIEWPDNYHVVTKPAQLQEIAEAIQAAGAFVFDVETSDTHPWFGKLYSMGIRSNGQCWAVPFEHALQPTIDRNVFRAALGRYFGDPDIKKMNHNLQFDGHFVEEQLGMTVEGLWCCTLLQAWVLNPAGFHGLKELCALYGLDDGGKNYTAQFGKTAWSHLPTKLANYYLCKDVDLVPKLFKQQEYGLTLKPKLHDLFWNVEMPVLRIIFEMERRGMKVDEDYLFNVLTPKIYQEYRAAVEALRPLLEPHLKLLKQKVTLEEALESHDAMKTIFFEGRGLPLVKHATLVRPDGSKEFVKRSLAKDAIVYFAKEREDMRLLGEFRKIDTVRKLIIDQVPKLLKNGYVHPSVSVIGADTGRMSMGSPNMQQIPSGMGGLIRNMFVPENDSVLLSFDFSQQEMRFMAHYSHDRGLYDIFTKSKLDMYSQMAIDVFNLDPSEFTGDPAKDKKHPQRTKTKVTVLGTGYGMMAAKLGRSLGVSKNEAQSILDAYFGRYPGIVDFQKRVQGFAQKNKYIPTLLGRERPVDTNRFGWERIAWNGPIQGSAADQTKLAARDCYNLIQKNGWPVRVWSVVHDEVIFEAKKAWVLANKDAILQLKSTMENAMPLDVPVVCNYVVEERWATEFDIDKHWDDLEEAA